MKYSLAALALAASSVFALAQEPPPPGGNSGGGQQMDRGADQSGQGAPSGAEVPSARDQAPGQMKDGGSARDDAPGELKGDGRSARDQAPGQRKDDAAEAPSRNEGYSKRGDSASPDAKQRRTEKSGSDSGAGSGASSGEAGSSSSGQKGSVAEVTQEQKSKVKSAFGGHKVKPARDIDINVNVGVAVPRSVTVYSVPADVIAIVPAYRGYKYFMLDEVRIVIVDPDTYEIVDIIVIA